VTRNATPKKDDITRRHGVSEAFLQARMGSLRVKKKKVEGRGRGRARRE